MDKLDEQIVRFVQTAPEPVGSAVILKHFADQGQHFSKATLNRRLEGLISARLLFSEGSARATRYRPDSYHDYFSVPSERRRKVSYDASILAAYEPNVTRWASEADRKSMEAAGGGRRQDASTYTRVISQKLLVDLSYGSSLLEGNTYTYLDTQVLIQFGQASGGKHRDETVMILNHKEAINYLLENVSDIRMEAREIKTIHALLSRGLSNMDVRDVGSVRRMPVDHIGGSSYLPMAIPQRLEEELDAIARKADLIEDPFEQSLFLMAFVSYLQAFRDVNKRTARIVCNVPLLQAGMAPLSFMDMDKGAYVKGLLAFYELGRIDVLKDAYVGAYMQSARRYEAYVGRPSEVVEIEFRRRSDIHGATSDYVGGIADGTFEGTAKEFATARFTDEEERERTLLVDRVVDVVSSLTDGNHIAYGIHRRTFDRYVDAVSRLSDPENGNEAEPDRDTPSVSAPSPRPH